MHASDCALQLKVSAEVTLPQQESGRVLDSLYKSLWRLNNTFMSLMAAGRNEERFLPVHVTPTDALFSILLCFSLVSRTMRSTFVLSPVQTKENRYHFFVSLSTNAVIQYIYLFCPHVVPLWCHLVPQGCSICPVLWNRGIKTQVKVQLFRFSYLVIFAFSNSSRISYTIN